MNEPRNLRKAYVKKLRACEISLSGNEINSSLIVFSRIIESDERIIGIKKF